jgi:AcrR family transcriptional regulator
MPKCPILIFVSDRSLTLWYNRIRTGVNPCRDEDGMNDANFCCTAPRNKADARRERVIEAARKLFIDKGFHSTGIAQIAKESGIAVGQLYRDFSAKEDIVAAIVDADCCAFMAGDSLRAAIENNDAALVRDWLHQFITAEDAEEDVENSRLFAEIVAEAGRNERIAAIFRRINDDVRGLMLNALEMLAPSPRMAERRAVLSDMISTMALGMLHQELIRRDFDRGPLARAFIVTVDREIDAMRAEGTPDQTP